MGKHYPLYSIQRDTFSTMGCFSWYLLSLASGVSWLHGTGHLKINLLGVYSTNTLLRRLCILKPIRSLPTAPTVIVYEVIRDVYMCIINVIDILDNKGPFRFCLSQTLIAGGVIIRNLFWLLSLKITPPQRTKAQVYKQYCRGIVTISESSPRAYWYRTWK